MDRRWLINKVVPGAVVALAFPVVGFYVGWFVGASRTPVVATLIPLIVGLLGAITFAMLDRRATLSKLIESAKKLQEKNDLPLGSVAKLESELGDPSESSFWLPALWSLGVIGFCVACYFGTQEGIRARVPALYPSVAELLANKTGKPVDNPTPAELACLHELRWHLNTKGIPEKEVKDLFAEVIQPLFVKPELPPPESIRAPKGLPPGGDGGEDRRPPPPPSPQYAELSWRSGRIYVLREIVNQIKAVPYERPTSPGSVAPERPPERREPKT